MLKVLKPGSEQIALLEASCDCTFDLLLQMHEGKPNFGRLAIGSEAGTPW